jgi:ABC-type Fe3+ transport system permease subunit
VKPSGGIAVGVAMAVFVLLLLLPILLVVVLYTFFTVYGMTKGTAFSASTLNPAVWWSGIAVLTAAFAVLIAAAASLIGKSLNPPKRRRHAEG